MEKPTRRSSRNVGQRRYDGSDSSLDNELGEYDDEDKKPRGKKKTPTHKPSIDPNDKKRGRPSKEIAWDDNYTGPLRRCAYIGHEELWGPEVPVELQPQYFYSTTARCIYCYKHLCNERHANKSKDKAAGVTSSKKKGRRRHEDDEDDEVITPSATTKRGRSNVKKRSRQGGSNEEEEWNNRRGGGGGQGGQGGQGGGGSRLQNAAPPPNVLHNAEQSLAAYTNGPRILQEWTSPPVATMEYTFAGMPQGAQPLQLKLNGASVLLQPAQFILHGTTSILINATPQACCLGWVSSDILVIGGGATLQVWGGLQSFTNPHLMYTLMLEGGNLVSFQVLPRSGVPKVRFAALAAVHTDGRVRLHSLPIPSSNEQQPLMIRQLASSPVSVLTPHSVQSLAVSSHPSHPNRLILGHQDGSLRWVDLPSNPAQELPQCQGNGGAGFSIAAAGYLPTSDAAFWAVGDSASVAIGDIREPFGGPVAPANNGGATESYLKTADSSLVFPALVAGGDGGHVWALPWAGEHTPPPRLLCSLNGAALSIKCHPFLPLAVAGCASGAARALWLPASQQKNQNQLIIHAASQEDEHTILVDAPSDLSDNGFKNAGLLACSSSAWAPDLDGRYAVAHSGGLVRVGVVRDFILRSAK